jgi:hypothetical protein
LSVLYPIISQNRKKAKIGSGLLLSLNKATDSAGKIAWIRELHAGGNLGSTEQPFSRPAEAVPAPPNGSAGVLQQNRDVRSNSLGLPQTLANLLHDLVWCNQAAAYIEPKDSARVYLTPSPPPPPAR